MKDLENIYIIISRQKLQPEIEIDREILAKKLGNFMIFI